MASAKKQIQQLSRQLFKMSLAEGVLSDERIAGVLAYVEKARPAHATSVLKAYRRLVAAEIARSQAVVEHAGTISAATLANISAAMSAKYGRRVTSLARKNDALLAGLRIRVGDDVYESSVAAQLAALAAAV
jgi:F-type H+-transporting ATPase subunit delta